MMYILGISGYFHDSAACLLHNDVIVAAVQEERFSRKKNDDGFPAESIKYCLETAGITLNELNHIVFYEKPFLKFERLLETYLAFAPKGFPSFIKSMPLWLKDKLFLKKKIIKALRQIDDSLVIKKEQLLFTTHHHAHAASAFYPSPYQNAVILVADGVGEWATTSVAIGTGNRIEFKKQITFPHSIGLLYSAFTCYLGFKVNSDEYKVMGLAPYGRPLYKDLIFKNIVDLKPDGSFMLNMTWFNYCTGLSMTSLKFNELFGESPRKPSDALTQFHMDVACSIQAVTEQMMLQLTSAIYEDFKIDNLCLAGGVALNCVVNGLILKKSGFKNIWVQPAAGDAGGALGAAYAVYYEHFGKTRKVTTKDKMRNALLGPEYDDDFILNAIRKAGLSFRQLTGDDFYPSIARLIADGKVIGYFQGRMEYGPRALGCRSILADARCADMQSTLNQKIKFRESFRPFAPAIMEEFAAEYFDISGTSPYMLVVSEINENLKRSLSGKEENINGFDMLSVTRSTIPAVTHVNYSARLQTVNKESHPDFYRLINAFYEITGCPLVINTSFNRMDEPIVNTPLQAIDCFNQTGMDALVIGHFVIEKAKQKRNYI